MEQNVIPFVLEHPIGQRIHKTEQESKRWLRKLFTTVFAAFSLFAKVTVIRPYLGKKKRSALHIVVETNDCQIKGNKTSKPGKEPN